MKTKPQHTPTPWQIEYQKIVDSQPSSGYNFNKIIAHPGHQDDWEANAKFIVRAVNSHEVLLNALKFVLNNIGGNFTDRHGLREIVSRAITQVEGK